MTELPPAEPGLHRLVESFFRDHLQRVRGASRHTVAAYRDALRLFFAFLADTTGYSVAELTTEHLRLDLVTSFLAHLEAGRGNSASTRNHRLTALRALFRHLIRHDPTRAEQYYRVICLPAKKRRQSATTYLEPEEMRIILGKPDCRTVSGIRDYALLLFMYNTGARVSETLGVREADLQLAAPAQVRLEGKGHKERLCPLWRETTQALRRMLARWPTEPAGRIFRNARGQQLTRDGVDYILSNYVAMATAENPRLAERPITPHVLRHSCAVALLQAGVDICVIRDYLGHASIATTSHYVKTNLRMKRDVLEAFWLRAGIATPADSAWEPKPDLLAFLNSL